jgi:hypothetical protein
LGPGNPHKEAANSAKWFSLVTGWIFAKSVPNISFRMALIVNFGCPKGLEFKNASSIWD